MPVSTIDLPDFDGTRRTANTLPALGQAAAAASLPVTIASDQGAFAVTGTFWQTTQPVSIATMPTTPVTGTFWQATQPVSLAAVPALVAGAAIIGKVGIDQTTPGTTNKVSVNTNGQATMANSSPVVVASDQSAIPVASSIANPTSTITLPSTTTAYTANQQVGGVGSFTWPATNGKGRLERLRLSTNDTTSTSWGGVLVQVDIWSASPTMGGDRTTFTVTAGAATHLGTFTGTFASMAGDGTYTELSPVGTQPFLALTNGATVYWTVQAVGVSGVTGASKVMTLTPEVSG